MENPQKTNITAPEKAPAVEAKKPVQGVDNQNKQSQIPTPTPAPAKGHEEPEKKTA